MIHKALTAFIKMCPLVEFYSLKEMIFPCSTVQKIFR